jgi:hypothetical protein
MIYPCDAITIPFSIAENTNLVLLPATTTPRTILNASIQNYGGNAYIYDGSKFLSVVYGNYVAQDNRDLTYKTKAEIKVYNLSTTYIADGQIVYVDRDIASTTEPVSCSPQYQTIQNITNNISGTASTTSGFTYGEIVNSTFLFLLLLVAVVIIFLVKVWGIKIIKKYD